MGSSKASNNNKNKKKTKHKEHKTTPHPLKYNKYNKKNKKYNYNHNTFKRKIPSTPIPNPSDPDLSPSAFRLGPEESDSDSSFDHFPFNDATKSSSKTNQKRFLN